MRSSITGARFRFMGRMTFLSMLSVALMSMAAPRSLTDVEQKRANAEANTFDLSSVLSAKPVDQEIAPSEILDKEPHGLGALPITEERLAKEKKEGREVKKIRLNKIGLARVNAERVKKGQRPLVAGVDLQVAPVGGEVQTEADVVVDATDPEAPASAGEIGGANPSAVNNSTLKYFPPVGNQGQVNSCVAWCEIYYTMTHETALQYDRDVKTIGNDAIFSPQFTYNFLNGGLNDGTYFGDHYLIAQKHGAVRLSEMAATTSFSRNWDTTSAHYRRAIDSRIDGYGYISSLNTAGGLDLLKTHLANGRIASYRTDFDGWVYKTLSNDPNTTGDDSAAGKWSVSSYTATSSGHGMTVVGYNDEIWCDLDSDGVIDANEKGGLLIANSWGTSWKSAGYCYIPYSILQTTGIFSSSRVYIATIKPVQYAPSVVARVTLNHNNRSQVSATVGSSAINKSAPTTVITSEIVQGQGGAYAFSGAAVAYQDFTYYIDMTDLAPSIGTAQRWYVRISDWGTGDVNLTMKAYDLIYVSSGVDRPVGSCSTVPVVANGTIQDAYIQWTMGDILPAVTVATAVTNASETSQAPGSWTITRDGSTAASLAVTYSFSGTATQGSDYTVSPASSVTIPAGQTSATVTLTPIDDSVADEGTENAILTIQANAAYYIAAATATVTIADNDLVAPAVSNQNWSATGPSSANMSGVIVTGAQASVYICWGEVDAGTATTSSWTKVQYVGTFLKSVPFTANVTGLGTNTTYWYRFYVTNAAGTGWSGTVTSFSGSPVNLSGGWTPAEINPSAWYDASTATINAGTVTVVNAGSSGGPVRGPASLAANGIGTLQAVQFSGTTQYLRGYTTNTATTLTAFFVGKSLNTTQTAYAGMMSIWGTGQANDWNNVGSAVLFGQNNTTINSVYTHRINSLSAATGALTNGFLAGTIFNSTNDTFYLNGTASTAVASTGNFNSDNVVLGGRWQGTSPFWNGRFGEAIICNTSLSASDRQKVEGYLAHKWGLANSLPTNHIYRTLPPGGAGVGVSVANLAPTAISNMTATLNGYVSALSTNAEIYVHWGLSDGGTNAGLWASSVKVGSYTNVTTNICYAATGLNPGQTYYYTFRAVTATTNLWASPSWSFRTSGQTSILAPSNLSATPGTGQINLTWTDNSTNETGFRVERSLSSMSGFTTLGAATANATGYTDNTVSPGPIYYYRVAATNATESSVVSGTASASLPKLPATVTISNTNQIYTGASRTVSTATEPAGLNVDVTYNGSSSEPINAGSYTVVATINDTTYAGTTNGTLVITQATPTVTAWPTAASIVEGQSLYYSELTGGSASVPGTFGFDSPSYVPPQGTNGIAVTFEADDAVNYLPVSGTVDVVVAEYHLDAPLLNHQGWTTNGTTGANLSSVLVAGDSASIWVCWGVTDSGTASTGNWDHVETVGTFGEGEPFTAHVTGLATNTTYWYRFVGTNAAGIGWSDTAVAFNGSPVGTDEPWTPVEMSTAAWYDASDTNTLWADPTGLTNATTKVARWDDKSGNNRHVAQSNSTQQPSYASSVITFDGTTNVLFNSSPFAYAMGSADVYVVAAVNTTAGRRLVAESLSTNFNPLYNPAQTHGTVGTAMAAYVRHDVGGSQSETFMATNPPLSAAGAFNINTNNLYHWRDAATNFTGRVAGGSPTTVNYTRSGTVTLDRFAVGAIGPRPGTPNGSVFVNAGIREIVITGVLSDTDRQKMEGYLAHKWTLAGNLPSDHPYKSQPPGVVGGVTVENLAPEAITDSTATLNAELSVLSTNADVYVHWGLSDGGTNAVSWAQSVKVGSYTNLSDTVSYAAEGLTPGQTYYYTFSISNATTTVWASPSWTFRTPGEIAILAPSNLSATPGPGQITLAWTDNSTNETGFRVERSLSSMSGFAMIGAPPQNATTYTDSAVTPGNTYYYRVAATNATDSSVVSATVSGSPAKFPATVTLNTLSQTYDGTARTVTATTVPGGLTVEITYNGGSIAPTDVGSYAVTGTVISTTYTGTTNGTLVVGQATPTVTTWPTAASIVEGQSLSAATLSGGSANVTGAFSYDAPTTMPPAGVYTAAVTFVAMDNLNYATVPGSVAVTVLAAPVIVPHVVGLTQSAAQTMLVASNLTVGTVTTAYHATVPVGDVISQNPVSGTSVEKYSAVNLVVSLGPKPVATVTLNNLSQTYDGTARTVMATTEPTDLDVDITYDGNASAPTNAGSYAVVATINEAEYQGQTNGTLVVGRATPTVNPWPNATSITLGQALSASTLSSGSASVQGSFAFVSPTNIPLAGITNAAVEFSPTDNVNYLSVTGTVAVTVIDINAIPFSEPFEDRNIAPLNGQNGWVAEGTFVQGTNTYGGSTKAAHVSGSDGYLKHGLSAGKTKVWTDLQIQVVQSQSQLMPDAADATVVVYVSTNNMVMAYNGTTVVETGLTAQQGQWIRLTVCSDYVAKNYVLYVNDIKAGPYGFYNSGLASYTELKVKGTATFIDDIAITEIAPPPFNLKWGTVIMFMVQ